MVKTFIALRHGWNKEFGVEFYHEKNFKDISSKLIFYNPIPGG